MRETTWTPGPWMVRDEAIVFGANGRRSVASCSGYQDSSRTEATRAENHANARLIAEAPALAKELEAVEVALIAEVMRPHGHGIHLKGLLDHVSRVLAPLGLSVVLDEHGRGRPEGR